MYLTEVEKKKRTKSKNDLGGELGNQGNVLLLGILLGETLLLSPGIPLGLALEVKSTLLFEITKRTINTVVSKRTPHRFFSICS